MYKYELANLIYESSCKGNIVKLAEKVGYSEATVYRWLNGVCEPKAKYMLKLADILNVPVEQIVRIFGEERNDASG